MNNKFSFIIGLIVLVMAPYGLANSCENLSLTGNNPVNKCWVQWCGPLTYTCKVKQMTYNNGENGEFCNVQGTCQNEQGDNCSFTWEMSLGFGKPAIQNINGTPCMGGDCGMKSSCSSSK